MLHFILELPSLLSCLLTVSVNKLPPSSDSKLKINAKGHHLTLQDVQDNILITSDVHLYVLECDPKQLFFIDHRSAPTEVVTLENTLNGTIMPQEEIIAISDYVHSQGLKMHLDGARIWHVAAETITPIKELCDPFDSVSLCFSKGLG